MAIETPRGLLVAALRETGRAIYAINPMAVARYRERHCVSGKKSDHVDAMTLANILRTDAHAHRILPADSGRRTKATQELRSLLREFYPGFLNTFTRGGVTNLASPEARAVLAIAPTPAAGAKLSTARTHGDQHAAALRHLFNRCSASSNTAYKPGKPTTRSRRSARHQPPPEQAAA